jgi:hypothetical protein
MKTLATFAAASLLALAGAAAVAQTSAPTPPPGATPAPSPAPQTTDQAPRGGMGRADFDALTDARIAGILAGLKLTPEQQGLWPPVEQALRARAAERADRFEEHRRVMRERGEQRGRSERDLDITQRLERQADQATQRARAVTERAERLTALSTAMKPFYASLDENQKRLLPVLMRERGDRGRRMGMHHHGRADMDRDSDGRRGMDRGGMMGRGGMMDRGPQRYH